MSAPTAEDGLNLSQDLRVKQVQIRELESKIDMYQGKAQIINKFSRSELTSLHDELEQALFTVSVAMKKTVGK